MSTVATPTLDRILDPVGRALNAEAARSLVGLRLDAKTQSHLDRLARKSNEGKLTAKQREEYETYVSAIDFVAILPAKARVRLALRHRLMAVSIRTLVRERAGGRCEYCHLPDELVSLARFHVEHIIARKHGGPDEPANRA